MVPTDARLCLLCGRAMETREVELELVGQDRETRAPAEPAVVRQRGPGRPRWSLLSVAAMGAMVAIVVIVLSNGDHSSSGADDATPTSAATIPSTTADARSAAEAGSSPMPSTTVAQLGPSSTPLLGGPTGGLSVYAVSGRSIARVDLDTGTLTVASLAIPRVGGQTTALAVYDGRLYIGRDLDLLTAPLDLVHGAEVVQSNVEMLGGGSTVVVRAIDPRNGQMEVRRLSPEGAIEQEWSAQGGFDPLWTARPLGDGLIVTNGGRIYTVAGGGVAQQYAIGEYVASNARFVLWRGCDEAMVCRYHLGDVNDPYLSVPSLDRAQLQESQWGPLLAPDGATLVVTDGVGSPMLLRTDDGMPLAKLDSSTRPAWTPDGEWLFTRSGGSTIVAISTRNGRQSSFTLRGLFGTQSMWLTVG